MREEMEQEPTVTLRFQKYSDREDLERVMRADDMAGLISDWEQYLRMRYRYDDERMVKMTAQDLIEEMYGENGEWWNMKDEHGINLDKLWS